PHGIAFTDKRPGSTSRWSTTGGATGGGGVPRCTTGGRCVSVGRVGRTGGGVADGGRTGSRAGGATASRLSLGGAATWGLGAGALATGARARPAGDAGIEEMPSHAPPPQTTPRGPARAAAIRRPGGFAAGSASASTMTTGAPAPRLRG